MPHLVGFKWVHWAYAIPRTVPTRTAWERPAVGCSSHASYIYTVRSGQARRRALWLLPIEVGKTLIGCYAPMYAMPPISGSPSYGV